MHSKQETKTLRLLNRTLKKKKKAQRPAHLESPWATRRRSPSRAARNITAWNKTSSFTYWARNSRVVGRSEIILLSHTTDFCLLLPALNRILAQASMPYQPTCWTWRLVQGLQALSLCLLRMKDHYFILFPPTSLQHLSLPQPLWLWALLEDHGHHQ